MARRGRPRTHEPGRANADRQAAFVARRNEIGDIPPVKHPRLKAKCANDLAAFGWYYCRDLLMHKPSADIRNGLIKDVQECIQNGGQVAELFGRGAGKTTWVTVIGTLWAILYGYSRYSIVIGSSMIAARKNLRTIKSVLQYSKGILEDFPGIARSIRAINGVAQRAAQQTYNGVNTNLEFGVESITLPMLRDKDGLPLEKGCGGIIQVAGVGSSIRGANINGVRPDLILLDDPQTRKDATSANRVQSIMEYIHSDCLGLAGHEKSISCFVTITPQKPGDVAMELSNQTKYPFWSVKVQPFVKSFPEKWDQLVELFSEQFAADAAAKDFARPRSRRWYEENKALFDGLEVIDPEQFDHTREVDARHHILVLRASLGEVSFKAEYLMEVREAETALSVTADNVSGAINGTARLVCPPGTDTVCGFCDVNIQAGAGLSWSLVAFGPKRVSAVIAYGRYPANGEPIVPPNASATMTTRRVTAAIRAVIDQIAALKIRDTKGRAVRIRAFGFDRGWLPEVVHRALYVIRKSVPLGFPIMTMRGFPYDKFGRSKKDILRRGDHIFAARSKFGEYLAVGVDYWREVQQSSWLEQPLTPGSLSIYGKDTGAHYRYAQEVVADKLIRKYLIYQGSETLQAWEWQNTGPEHWGDTLTNAFALASWFRAYDALSKTIDEVALGVKTPEQYDASADDTEGVGEKIEVPIDLETAIEDGKPIQQFNTLPKRKPKIKFRFKRGRYCK